MKNLTHKDVLSEIERAEKLYQEEKSRLSLRNLPGVNFTYRRFYLKEIKTRLASLHEERRVLVSKKADADTVGAYTRAEQRPVKSSGLKKGALPKLRVGLPAR